MGGTVRGFRSDIVEADERFEDGSLDATARIVDAGAEDDERVVVGVNRYVVDDEVEPEILSIDPALQAGQIERVRRLRADRDQAAVEARLDDVRAAARGTQNLLPPMRAALASRATLGEVSDALREVFGQYQPGR